MKIPKTHLLLLAGLLLSRQASAQYDASFSHYFDMETSFNPAAAGQRDAVNMTAAYAMDLTGFKHNPQTFYAAADMPFLLLNRRHGGGVQLLNDKIGLFTHQRVAGQYAFRGKLLGGVVALGVQAGMLSEKFDGSKVDTEDPGDPAFATSLVTGSALDLGLGLMYFRPLWHAGVSVQHVNSPTVILGATNELAIEPSYYLTAGCNIKLRNPFLTIKPTMLLRADGTGWRADVTTRLVYTHDDKMMYGGLGYSPGNSLTVLVGGKFHGIVLGYSYEAYTSGLEGNGSHGVFLGYQLGISLTRKGRNRHQSVRLL